jgi:hypothetical protein
LLVKFFGYRFADAVCGACHNSVFILQFHIVMLRTSAGVTPFEKLVCLW